MVYGKTGSFFSTDKWKRLKRAAIKRDGYKCIACGVTKRLTAHHIIARAKGGQDVIDNLEILCVPCHDKAELGEDIFPTPPGVAGYPDDWRTWVYGGFRNPMHDKTWNGTSWVEKEVK